MAERSIDHIADSFPIGSLRDAPHSIAAEEHGFIGLVKRNTENLEHCADNALFLVEIVVFWRNPNAELRFNTPIAGMVNINPTNANGTDESIARDDWPAKGKGNACLAFEG
jgi:hypothetical protein